MTILEKDIKINLIKNHSHYEDLGYEVPRIKDNKGRMVVKKGTILIVKIKDLPLNSTVKLMVICDVCGMIEQNKSYSSIVKSRKDNKDLCYSCKRSEIGKNRMNNVKYEKSLEWYAINNNKLYLLNELSDKNNKKAKQISYGSEYEYLWLCPKCNSEYKMSVKHRTYKNCNCPFCRGYRVNETNSLATKFPNICLEWNFEKNKLKPSEITPFSRKIVWWICDKGHEWEACVSDRSYGHECPYCKGLYPTSNNNLLIKHPEICTEWNFKKNSIFPEEYLPNSNKEVWWICSNCNYEWKSRIQNRVQGNNCPMCNVSKGEKEIINWLKINYIHFEFQKTFKNLLGLNGGLLSYDFYLPKYNFLIEYQGEFHDGNGNYFVKQNLENQQDHDRRKREYANKNNIKLLEIWYYDFNRIEDILTEAILRGESNEIT